MKMFNRVAQVFGKEFDPHTRHFVRAGWPAQRQSFMDAAATDPATLNGTCTLCHQRIGDHPIPERLWSADPTLCPRKG